MCPGVGVPLSRAGECGPSAQAVFLESPLLDLVQPRDLGKHSLTTPNVMCILCDVFCQSAHGLWRVEIGRVRLTVSMSLVTSLRPRSMKP